ncbi:MAG: hypothetical protein HY321_10870 [Armatimonadetes bacterium]|nr:hypothetical protein [Armatimonadota bacterium]
MAKKRLIIFALSAGLLVGSVGTARALLGGTIGTAIKVFGIGYAVRVFGPQINSFINSVTLQRGLQPAGATKVVPILSLGQGLYVGAAQVVGPSARVGEVQAVGQGQISIGDIRLNGLFPVNRALPVGGTPETVGGVGVSAIIDFNV